MTLTAEADSLPTDGKELLYGYGFVDAIRAEAMICQLTPELIHQDIFDSCGNQTLQKWTCRNL